MFSNENERNSLFTRRTFLINGVKFSLLSVIAARMGYIQLFKNKEYQTKSDLNRISVLILPPLRGKILDRNNKLLAINRKTFQLFANSEIHRNPHTITKISKILSLNAQEMDCLIEIAKKATPRSRVMIMNNISWQNVATIEENLFTLPGIDIELGFSRYYPHGSLFANILGYIGLVNTEEQNELGVRVGNFQVGKTGMEKKFESHLRGDFGFRKMEVNAKGVFVRELENNASIAGGDLNLSLDLELQKFAIDKLDPRGSSAIVMDVHSGELVVCASTPGFDNNKFIGGISHNYWKELLDDPYRPLINKIVSNHYPPGSIFKLVVFLAALESGIKPDFQYNCQGHITSGNRTFRCWYRPGHGNIGMLKAIQTSCNAYVYNLGQIIGVDKIVATARKLGFGDLTDIDLPHEIKGFLPSKTWKQQLFNQKWTVGDTFNTSIGQGYVSVTPIQLVRAIAAIANKGKLLKPQLVKGLSPIEKTLNINPEYFDILQQGMNLVVNHYGGTSYRSRITDNKFHMAGKTGTSQVKSKRNDRDDFSLSSTEWQYRNHGLFAGFGPIANPKFACCVIIDHGGGGARAAAPVARDILLKTMQKYNDTSNNSRK